VVKSFPSNTWQLGFECGAAGWHIITNSVASWFIYNTRQTVADAVVSMPAGVDHLFDVPSAFPDSTAVGNWVTPSGNGNAYTHNVYLLGYYHNGKFNTLKQLVFLDENDTSYRFFCKEQVSGTSDTVTVIKNDTVDYVYYNFDKQQEVNLEPDKSIWDLAFGPYYDLATLFGVTIPYQVGGAYLNAGLTEAALDSINPFNAINAGMIPGYRFRTQRNIPGYLWKSVTVDVTGGGSATYKVKTNYTYIFHTARNNYFKLKFLSYTHNGQSGFPQFEFQKLK
jgi:hypothetical protein